MLKHLQANAIRHIYIYIHIILVPVIIHSVTTTDRHEAVVELGRVEQSPGLSGLFQDWQHDLVPQGCVETDDLLDIAEQLGRLHLCQQTTFLQV